MGRKKISEGGTMTATAWKKGQVTNPNGRACEFTEEIGQRIIDLLWSGECKSLHKVAQQPGMPTRMTIYNWRNKFPEFGFEVRRAQAALAELYADEIDEIKDRVVAGTLEPAAGNVAIRSNQWKAMVTNPRDYSNRSYVEKNENVQITTQRINRIDITGLTEEALDALESALQAKLLPSPDDDSSSAGED